jgi:hypothetical protein
VTRTITKGRWTTSGDGLVFCVGGSIVGTITRITTRAPYDCYSAHGCMSDWQDTDLGQHDSQMAARKAVTDWVKENADA